MTDFEFALPDVGEGLADATVVHWLVAESETVEEMQPIVEVETAKSLVEIPSPVTGVLVRHGAAEGQDLEVGAILAVIATTADAASALPSEIPPSLPSEIPPSQIPPSEMTEIGAPTPEESRDVPALAQISVISERTGVERAGAERTGVERAGAERAGAVGGAARRVAAAPTVRRRAVELGIDLTTVAATGPGGRVLMSDLVEHDASAPIPREPLQGDRVEKLGRMRTAIAGTLGAAWAQVPLITDLRDVDAVRLVDARASLAAERAGSRIGYTAFFAAATVAALLRFPQLNASLDLAAETVTYHGNVHLGIAVSVPDGLAVAVVRNAQSLSLDALSTAIDTLSEKARAGRLSTEESTGATFTVSSFGRFGGWYGTPLVVPPQVAIAGFGPIRDRVVPWQGAPAIRATLPMSVSADHRLIDGALLSQFCSRLEELVSDPIRFLGS